LAEAAFTEALRLDDALATAHLGLGHLLLAREDMLAAAREFERVLELSPGSARAEYFLGVTWLARDQLDEAAAHFDLALQLGANEVVGTAGAKLAFGRLAAAYDAAGRPADGVRWRKAAVARAASNAEAY
jgi:tetratricopeptide (TPR) repeat protein